MYCFWPVFLLLIAVGQIQSEPKPSSELQKNVRGFSTIEHEARSFKCGKPQKRAYTAEKIVQDHHPEIFGPDSIFAPPMIVLHRCDQNSGCCFGKNHTCAPKKIDSVQLMLKTGDGTPLMVNVLNHTECHCVSRSSLHWKLNFKINGIALSEFVKCCL